MADNVINYETSGVYKGTLIEDMVDTVSKVGFLAIDVEIPRYWTADDPHPLVKVTGNYLPYLKKGTDVYVKFSNDSLMYPYLYYVERAFPAEVGDDAKGFPFPDKQQGEFDYPNFSSSDNVTRTFIPCSDSTSLWVTEAYSVLVTSGHFIAITPKGVFLKSSESVNLSGDKGINFFSSGGTVNLSYGQDTSLEISSSGIKAKVSQKSIEITSSQVAINGNSLVVS